MLAERAKAMQRLCFGASPSEADLQLLGSPERWLIYRDMVRHRLAQVIGVALPRTREALGSEVFDNAICDWLSSGGPKTRYLRGVPTEFTERAIPAWEDHEKPWLADLARLEIASWNVRHAPPAGIADSAVNFDRVPVLNTALEVLRLSYSVHEAGSPSTGYTPNETLLCVYRNEKHRASVRKLNPLAADLLDAWKHADETITDSVQRVAAAHQTEITPAFVEKLSDLVADFLAVRGPSTSQ